MPRSHSSWNPRYVPSLRFAPTPPGDPETDLRVSFRHIHPRKPAMDDFHDRLPPVVVESIDPFDARRAKQISKSDARLGRTAAPHTRVTPGRFLRPARRTRRAPFNAPGSPHVVAVGQPLVATAGVGVQGVLMMLPR